MGRPPKTNTKYNKTTLKNIAAVLRKMGSRVEAAEAAGITYKTFMEWYHEKPEFQTMVDDIYEEMMDRQKNIAIQTIFAAMGDKVWTASAWWLERKHPEEFAVKKQQLEISGKIDHRQIMINVTAPQTKALMENAIKLLTKDGEEIKTEE